MSEVSNVVAETTSNMIAWIDGNTYLSNNKILAKAKAYYKPICKSASFISMRGVSQLSVNITRKIMNKAGVRNADGSLDYKGQAQNAVLITTRDGNTYEYAVNINDTDFVRLMNAVSSLCRKKAEKNNGKANS